MNVRFAFLCDAAEQGQGGKISALGIGIEQFIVSDLNHPVPPFTFVCSLSGTSTEVGTKKVAIHLIDEDGRDVIPAFQGELKVAKPPSGNRWQTGIMMQHKAVKFPRYGSYSISVVVDGHEMVNVPFTVVPPPQKGKGV